MKRIPTLTTPFGTFTDVRVEPGNYASEEGPGAMALTLWDGYGEMLATVSVNLPGYPLPEGPGWFYAKAYSENEGLPEALRDAGVLTREGITYVGPFESPVYLARLTEEYRA